MKSSNTGDTVTVIMDLDQPLPPELIARLDAEFAARKGQPIDLSDIPEQHIDETWIRPGLGNSLGLTMLRAKEAAAA